MQQQKCSENFNKTVQQRIHQLSYYESHTKKTQQQQQQQQHVPVTIASILCFKSTSLWYIPIVRCGYFDSIATVGG